MGVRQNWILADLLIFFKILLHRVLIGFLWMCFRRNLLGLLLCFLFLVLCYVVVLNYMQVHLSIFFLLFLPFRWLLLFLFGIVLWIFRMVIQRLIFWPIRLYILVFLFCVSLLFAFLNRILWGFCVFVRMNSIYFLQDSVYMLHNYCSVFLFCLVFLGLCVVLCILQKSVSSFLLGIWMRLIHNHIQNGLYDMDLGLIFLFFLSIVFYLVLIHLFFICQVR